MTSTSCSLSITYSNIIEKKNKHTTSHNFKDQLYNPIDIKKVGNSYQLSKATEIWEYHCLPNDNKKKRISVKTRRRKEYPWKQQEERHHPYQWKQDGLVAHVSRGRRTEKAFTKLDNGAPNFNFSRISFIAFSSTNLALVEVHYTYLQGYIISVTWSQSHVSTISSILLAIYFTVDRYLIDLYNSFNICDAQT